MTDSRGVENFIVTVVCNNELHPGPLLTFRKVLPMVMGCLPVPFLGEGAGFDGPYESSARLE